MEVDAVIEMFQRSEELYQVKYANYIGDGDSKTFKGILDCEPYENFTVSKKECVDHVQKRIETRLRNLKKVTKGLGGKGKLTGKLIDELIDLLRSGDTSKSQFSRKNAERHLGNAVSQNVYGRRTAARKMSVR